MSGSFFGRGASIEKEGASSKHRLQLLHPTAAHIESHVRELLWEDGDWIFFWRKKQFIPEAAVRNFGEQQPHREEEERCMESTVSVGRGSTHCYVDLYRKHMVTYEGILDFSSWEKKDFSTH
ncbi:hypothetical protein LR48_Vigan05g069500 [Vigna angularis]|uniref:Uncharacterized protein n=1 Tax=Phaseolus angularis TaxID=3914 RepID=A0A0L9UK80_PHAAN|nr:hypothetical protein LR48_Vigan05g069500 [Vigna angularis]